MIDTLNLDNGAAPVPGVSPQVYSQKDFERIARLVRKEAGIVLSDGKRMLAYSRLAPMLRKNNCSTFSEYLDRIEKDTALSTLTIAALTTNHTYFHRESHHYDHFAATVRPELVAALETSQPVRIWSAGCSSGEEIYTLMMVLLGEDRTNGTRLATKPILALASDLAGHAIAAGQKARYQTKAIEAVPEKLRRNWCKTIGNETEVCEEVRALVRFRQLNLLGKWPLKAAFDVIFCRNVMIYFDHETKEELVRRLANQLRPGGHLYIGHSERVSGPAAQMLEPVGPTVYRRR